MKTRKGKASKNHWLMFITFTTKLVPLHGKVDYIHGYPKTGHTTGFIKINLPPI